MSQSKSMFFGVMGAPFESELTTSVLRMVDEAIRQQHYVTVWTCGGATTLTLKTLTRFKPRNILDVGTSREDTEYPSTVLLIEELIRHANGQLDWCVCRHCMEERGAIDQIENVKIQAPFKFVHYLEHSDIVMVLGKK